jgi:hypothetical protein
MTQTQQRSLISIVFIALIAGLIGQGLKKSPSGQKLDFANHPYLCKGLNL